MKLLIRLILLPLILIMIFLLPLQGCDQINRSTFHRFIKIAHHWAGVDEAQLKIDQHQIAYLHNFKHAGQSTPPLLFVHGFASNKDSWLQIAKQFSRHHPVILLDLPGHGLSDFISDTDYRISTQAHRLNDFLQQLNIDKVHVIGHSMGGGISLLLAHYYPDKVQQLILIDPAGVDGAQQSRFFNLLNTGYNPLIVRKPGDFKQFIDFVTYKKPYIPGFVRRYVESDMIARQHQNEKIFTDIMVSKKQLTPEKVKAILSGLPMPVLLFWGEHDDVLNVSATDVFAQHVRNRDIVIYPEVGHCPNIEVPKKMAAKIQQALSNQVDEQSNN